MRESDESAKNNYTLKSIKYLGLIIIFIYFTFSHSFKRKKHLLRVTNISSLNKNFSDIIPRINLNDDNTIPSLKDILYSRQLYINGNNLTNEYIRYIRPINETGEEIYKRELFPNLEFNDLFEITRKDQYDVLEFHDLCKKGILLDDRIYNMSEEPAISLVLPSFNKENDLLKSVRSIQNQSFKNIEIIIVNDCSNDNSSYIFNYLLETDPRVRVFHHLTNLGCWRSRLDGFLYSKGKYVLHFDTGDAYIDNYVLEDIYNYAEKYKLDSVRFSFQWVHRNNVSHDNYRKIFRREYTKIRYGHVDYTLFIFGYGTIWNRLTRANIFSKGLDLIDGYILNAYKNLWEDAWWNEMANIKSFSHLTVNRVGYLYFPSYWGEGMLKVGNRMRQEKAIREFILFWLFSLEILPKNDTKTSVIQEMKKFVIPENKVRGKVVVIDYLQTECPLYEHLLNTLINDPYIVESDKKFVRNLMTKYMKIKKRKYKYK
jgi:glycosyltransferase involved in cell wall biosynthesis